MTDAWDIATGKLVSSESLKYLKSVDSNNYKCIGCSVRLIPCSYRAENKKRPYFRMEEAARHDIGCSEELREKYVKVGKKRSIKTSHGFPIPYVNKLIEEPVERIVVRENQSINLSVSASYSPTNSTQSSSMHRNRGVTTIKQIVQHYLDFPKDRDLNLTIPGVTQNTYSTVFKRINYRYKESLLGRRIFYGEVYFNRAPVWNGCVLRLMLAEGEWERKMVDEKSKNVLTKYFSLDIDTTGWSKHRIALVEDMIKYTQEETKSTENKGFVFFLGTLKNETEMVFEVTNHRHIYFRVHD